MDETAIVDRYCAAWNEPDADKRFAMLLEITTPDVRYVDPTVDLSGRNALNAHIDVVSARYPGSVILRTTEVDHHNRYARFGWKKVLSDGSSLADSIDVAEFGDDRKLRLVVGFFGPLKPAS